MAGAMVDFPGRPESVGCARRWVESWVTGPPWGRVVPEGVAVAAVLVVSELATNAVRHTASGAPGGVFRVRVVVGPGSLRLGVCDGGATARTPTVVGVCRAGEGGYGLNLVAHFADRWGTLEDPPGVFAHWTWPPEGEGPPDPPGRAGDGRHDFPGRAVG